MQVFIMRHGAASLEASKDSDRPLLVYGYNQSVCMAAFLKEKSYKIEKVLISPYLRAQQTLGAVREVLTFIKDVKIMSDLKPYGNVSMVICFLSILAKKGITSVMVISHLPLISHLVVTLCPEYILPVFSTSAITCISCFVDTKNSVLEWHMNPTV